MLLRENWKMKQALLAIASAPWDNSLLDFIQATIDSPPMCDFQCHMEDNEQLTSKTFPYD